MMSVVITRLRGWDARRDSERGAISAMVVLLIVMLFAVAGLVYDGGAAINARQQAYDDAEQAARAGANQIDIGLFRSEGVLRIMEADAEAAAWRFLTDQLPGDRAYDTISVDADAGTNTVQVYVERSVPTQLLQLVFVDSFTVEANATSEPEVGILGGGAP